MEIDIKIIETDDDYQSCLFIRKQVFIIGQNIPVEIELDDDKINATYFLANLSGNPVGTARYRKTDVGVKLERFSVLKEYRGFGIGKALVAFIIEEIKHEKTIYLNSQENVVRFYSKLGFKVDGSIFFEANIPHFKMILK